MIRWMWRLHQLTCANCLELLLRRLACSFVGHTAGVRCRRCAEWLR